MRSSILDAEKSEHYYCIENGWFNWQFSWWFLNSGRHSGDQHHHQSDVNANDDKIVQWSFNLQKFGKFSTHHGQFWLSSIIYYIIVNNQNNINVTSISVALFARFFLRNEARIRLHQECFVFIAQTNDEWHYFEDKERTILEKTKNMIRWDLMSVSPAWHSLALQFSLIKNGINKSNVRLIFVSLGKLTLRFDFNPSYLYI